MSEIILIGTGGETRAFAAAGLRCFEPGRGRLIERVLAERVRCRVLALTPGAFSALPAALAVTLRESPRPALAIVPPLNDPEEAALVVDRLYRHHAGSGDLAA